MSGKTSRSWQYRGFPLRAIDRWEFKGGSMSESLRVLRARFLERTFVSSEAQCHTSASEAVPAFAGQPDANSNWYALRVKSKFESVASATLRGKGYREFLPLYRSRRRWSDRVKEIDVPLFPGYLFCHFDAGSRLLPILTTPGVVSIVGAGKTPVPVSEAEIDAIQAVVRSGLPALPWPCLTVGSRVLIEAGPL